MSRGPLVVSRRVLERDIDPSVPPEALSVSGRIRRRLWAGEILYIGDVAAEYGKSLTLLQQVVSTMTHSGYRFKRHARSVDGKRETGYSMLGERELRDDRPAARRQSKRSQPVGEIVHAAPQRDIAAMEREIDALRAEIERLHPRPVEGIPKFGSVLRVVGLYEEREGQVKLVLRNGDAEALVCRIESVVAGE